MNQTSPYPYGFQYNWNQSSGMPYQTPQNSQTATNWSTNWINQHVEKAGEKWLKPYMSQGETTPSHTNMDSSFGGSASTSDVSNSQPIGGAPEPEKEQAPKRKSAKEMWESTYLEEVGIGKEEVSVFQEKITRKNPKEGNLKKRGHHLHKKGFGKRKASTSSQEPETSSGDKAWPKLCKLCSIEMYNINNADHHYASPQHKRNVNKFLNEGKKTHNVFNEKIKQLSSKLPTNTPECLSWNEVTSEDQLNTVKYCRLCSVTMSSFQNAKQHYAGKSHAKRIRMVESGQQPSKKIFKATNFISGGTLNMMAETPKQYVPVAQTSINNNMTKPSLPPEFANTMTPSGQFYCKTCNVTIEHAGNLRNHLQSKAHKYAKYQVKGS